MNYCSVSIIINLFFAILSIPIKANNGYLISNFTKQEYNAESQNWSITQNQQGFVYAANNVGLLEFDGVEWNFYPSPKGTVIRSVAVGANNRIYTSGYREIGFWERNRMGRLVYTSLNPKAEPLFSKNEEFWNTVIIGDRVYFHSFTSVFAYYNEAFHVIRPGPLITSISELDGQLCMHLSQEGLYLTKDTLLEPFITHPEFRNDQVHFCLVMHDSSLLIGTSSSGLFLFKEGKIAPFASEWVEFFSEKKINRGTITRNGNVIIGTLLGGLVIFDQQGELVHRINVSQGLQNNTILGIRSDAENNIWLALDQGISFITFNVDPSYSLFKEEDIGAVYSSAVFRGDLYMCTNQGIYFRSWEDETEIFRIIPGTQGQAWSCGVYNNQLIVSHNVGTFRIENYIAERISNISGGFAMTRDPVREDVLVQSTYSDIVFFEQENREWRYNYRLPQFNDLIRYIELDHLNNLWASHMHRGIYRLKLNDTHDSILNVRYYGESIFGKNYNIQVFKIESRIVFTTGNKVYTYNDLNDSIILYNQLNQKLDNYSQSHRIVPANDHHYWFISPEGIGLFQIFDSKIERIREYPSGLFKDHLIAGYENIYPLNTTEGLLCLDNGYAYLRADQPDISGLIENKELSLKSIVISGRNGKSEELPLEHETITIPFNRNTLSLGFSFPFFSGKSPTFQSFVEDLDVDWSDPVGVPVFNFTRIPTGQYRILIRALNEWNKRSIEKVIQVQVLPPWYLNRWSFTLYGVIIILLLIAGRYILLNRIRMRERKIKESKEKELIRLRNEKLNAELSFKSQELATSTMAIIRKNEFLLKLKETIRKQKEDLGTRYPEKYYVQLVKKIDANIASMDDWNVFEIHFEKAHEKFLHKMITKFPHLSHSDLRLCAYLRMNLTSKEIAPLLRISYRGVENHRYRLRQKFHLKKEVNLTDFILSI